MFLTTAIKVKAGLITGMIVGSLLGLTAQKMLENRICLSKNFKTKHDEKTDVSNDAGE